MIEQLFIRLFHAVCRQHLRGAFQGRNGNTFAVIAVFSGTSFGPSDARNAVVKKVKAVEVQNKVSCTAVSLELLRSQSTHDAEAPGNALITALAGLVHTKCCKKLYKLAKAYMMCSHSSSSPVPAVYTTLKAAGIDDVVLT